MGGRRLLRWRRPGLERRRAAARRARPPGVPNPGALERVAPGRRPRWQPQPGELPAARLATPQPRAGLPPCRACAAVSASLLALLVAGMPSAAQAAELPLGSRSLDERRDERDRGARGQVDVDRPRGRPLARERAGASTVPRSPGGSAGILSNERVAGLERPSSMARRTAAVAGVNGGFFAVDGDPVGALAIDGRVLSEPVNGRSALLVPADPAAGAADRRAPLQRLRRRRRGAAADRRGRPAPRQHPRLRRARRRPAHAAAGLGPHLHRLERARRIRVALRGAAAHHRRRGARARRRRRAGRPPARRPRARGRVRAVRQRRRRGVPARLARAGAPAQVELGLGEGEALVTGGGPRLLVRGRVAVAASAEGFAPLSAPGFVASRHPRTLAGVERDGRCCW